MKELIRQHWMSYSRFVVTMCLSMAFVFANAASTPQKTLQKILVVGDSMSAEYGLPRGSGWVALLQKKLNDKKPSWQVVNASISGDTTAGGLARLPQLLAQHKPQILVLELGGNDALRGLQLQQTRTNIASMVNMAQKTKIKVLLLGMQIPPNYGADYSQEFARIFTEISTAQRVALVPFLLKGVGDVPDSQRWFQADRIHPNAQAQPLLLDNVWAQLKRMLQ